MSGQPFANGATVEKITF